MDPRAGNLFAALPVPDGTEQLTDLLARPGLRIERIVSTGQSSPPGEWYDQDFDEWVVLLLGAGRVEIEGETALRMLGPGDWLFLPAHCRHRLAWTHPSETTIWLAIHVGDGVA